MQKGASKREAEKSSSTNYTANLVSTTGMDFQSRNPLCDETRGRPDYEKARTFDKNIAKEKASYGRESPDRRTTQAVLKETKSTLLE